MGKKFITLLSVTVVLGVLFTGCFCDDFCSCTDNCEKVANK